MKKSIIIILTVVVSLFTTSCMVTFPGIATQASSVKVGIAEKKVWFGIAKDIDVSIATAAKNGGITKIATVDVKVYSDGSVKTIVTGE